MASIEATTTVHYQREDGTKGSIAYATEDTVQAIKDTRRELADDEAEGDSPATITHWYTYVRPAR